MICDTVVMPVGPQTLLQPIISACASGPNYATENCAYESTPYAMNIPVLYL